MREMLVWVQMHRSIYEHRNDNRKTKILRWVLNALMDSGPMQKFILFSFFLQTVSFQPAVLLLGSIAVRQTARSSSRF